MALSIKGIQNENLPASTIAARLNKQHVLWQAFFMLKSSNLCISHCLPEERMYSPLIRLIEDSKNKSAANRKLILFLIFHFTIYINDVTLTADSISLYMPTTVLPLCLRIDSQPIVLTRFIANRKSIWPFMFPETFGLSNQKTSWFPFRRQDKFICCISTVVFFFFIYRLRTNHCHSGRKRHHCLIHNQAMMQRSEAHNKSKRRFRLENKGTLVQLGMMERGSGN